MRDHFHQTQSNSAYLAPSTQSPELASLASSIMVIKLPSFLATQPRLPKPNDMNLIFGSVISTFKEHDDNDDDALLMWRSGLNTNGLSHTWALLPTPNRLKCMWLPFGDEVAQWCHRWLSKLGWSVRSDGDESFPLRMLWENGGLEYQILQLIFLFQQLSPSHPPPFVVIQRT